ncbi:hypothetical protein M409DRAFT_23445 [Zasmidium cellare ATCC 36951]|uniref:Heterokaryon incompatibility domain-containing protein n=1 Tax=Zasmidium cellare ATCC 36951 TaxID=1080233 RepID=A0A6A6CI12_ZASCE|nr:uncharacterized protein M409DRAFT_23445 [Zasmidium cellare ATCC 36951]KAF2166253.1 hypothetical protein M409DRAFT_23445 [Zasmidium cellare ATCC 36951]
MAEATETILVREAGGERKRFFIPRPRRIDHQTQTSVPEFSKIMKDHFGLFAASTPSTGTYMQPGQDIDPTSFVSPCPPQNTPSHQPIPGQDICECCEDIDIPRLFGHGNVRRYLMRDARAIFQCMQCALCRLLTGGFQSTIGLTLAETCNLPIQLHVVLTSVQAVLPLVKGAERQHELQAYVLDEEGSRMGEASMRLLGDAATKIGRSKAFKGRLIDPAAVDFSLAREWLHECDTGHYPKHGLASPSEIRQSSPRGDSGHHSDVSNGLVVVDVHERCLKQLPPNSRFLTLSYTWPLFDTLKLNRANHRALMAPGALADSNQRISNVIREAMSVVERLGEKYIWIDALCITQDDDDIRSGLISRMDQIYGDSYLNIIVATASTAGDDYSIPGVGTSRLSQQVTEELDGLRLVTALKDYNAALEKSRWATRGWIFQEGLLAERCLVFTDDQMYFRCKSDYRCEDATCEGIVAGFSSHPARPRQRESKLDFLMTLDFHDNVCKGVFFPEYGQLVREYSKRSLTNESDISDAFTGILNVLSGCSGCDFFHARPVTSLERSMMWYPIYPGERRPGYPSWSWLGWRGPVDFETDIIKRKDEEVCQPLVWWFIFVDFRMHPVRPDTPPNIELSIRELFGCFVPQLILEPSSIIAQAAVVRRRLRVPEEHICSFVTVLEQTLPFFAILDRDNRACGFLPSVDRNFARGYAADQSLGIELAILAETPLCKADTLHDRARFFHEDYDLTSPTARLCSVMLITYDGRGIASRRGVGKIHKDSVDAELAEDASRRILALG